MNRLLLEIGRSQRLAVVHELKRSGGLPVKELSRRLGMSYMGVKQHCIELERDGYLVTWRNPKPVGRPEIIYRLSRKAHELFPVQSNEMLLDVLKASRSLFGPTTPGKLLFIHFRNRTDGYLRRVRGDTPVERAKWLSRHRDREGCLSTVEEGPPLRIIERHSPILELFEAFPEAENMEREMIEKVVGGRVRRQATVTAGLYECIFEIVT